MSRFLRFYLASVAVVIGSCAKERPLFNTLEPNQCGITFENRLTPSDDFNIIDYLYFYNGGGVAVGDINGDDLPDVFFSGNQVKNRLYLNKGGLKFEDITEKAGVAGNSTWNTGAVMADVNGDGLLDIYVCAVVGLKNLEGHNELFINNGDNTFTESAAKFGLDFESFSSSAAFLDFDMDGDLDIYLLNHAVHTQESFAHAKARYIRSYETGDKLLRNDDGKFVDVSEHANIYGGVNGYGLGIAIADFNLDGYPDIHIGNDFHEDDYLYMNNRDGTFSETGKQAFTMTSKFSMGSDVADINHDGYPDLFTLDMLAEDETVLKRSEADEHVNILKLRTREYGYGFQFQRNMMQVNQADGTFKETALIGGIAATDWSWSAIFADFDQDGNQDLFVSNGIPRRPNDLDYIKYVSNEKIVNTIGTTKLVDETALSLMPSGKINNYIFKGSGGYIFEDQTRHWLPDEKTCSSATAVADLDGDGDLDIVVNNIDDKPGIYINRSDGSSNFLKIKLRYAGSNTFSIGSRVSCYSGGILQSKELYTVRGFQSSSEPLLHFGFDRKTSVDSVKIVWPNGSSQTLFDVRTNQLLKIVFDSTKTMTTRENDHSTSDRLFQQIDGKEIGLSFQHKEDSYTDFDRIKLLPYQQSDRGPATAVGDMNNDGLSDIYFGGSKHIPAESFMQNGGKLVKTDLPEIKKDSVKEDIDALIADFTGDGQADIYVGTGGADFFGRASPLLDNFYISTREGFARVEIPDFYENASCVRSADFDNDGDLDIFVGSESVSNDFGKMPQSYLLMNDNGIFEPVQKEIFGQIGMVTDAVWHDYNGDGYTDLVVVGEWMPPTFIKNNQGKFERDNRLAKELAGLWQSISCFDVDGDGDTDYVLGNWGLNSKFRATENHPMRMYYGDFDQNGQSESIVAIEKEGKYYPLDGFDLIASQVITLRKKFTSYKAFAGKTMEEIFSKELLAKAGLYEIHQLASGYLENDSGTYRFVAFSSQAQLAPIMSQLVYDFDGDGSDEILLAGNYFGMQPFHGRFGSMTGMLIEKGNKVIDGKDLGLNLFNNSVRHMNIIKLENTPYLIVTVNNGKAQVYRLIK